MGKLCASLTSVMVSVFVLVESFAGTVRAGSVTDLLQDGSVFAADKPCENLSSVSDVNVSDTVSDPAYDTERVYLGENYKVTFSLVSFWDNSTDFKAPLFRIFLYMMSPG